MSELCFIDEVSYDIFSLSLRGWARLKFTLDILSKQTQMLRFGNLLGAWDMNLTYLSRINLPTLISRTSPFPILGVLGVIFHIYSNSNRTFCEQTVGTLIGRRVLQHLIWDCTVCLCPTKRTLDLYGLKSLLKWNRKNIYPQSNYC